MIDFEIKSKTQPIGTRKGQTVYFAQPKSQQYFTNKMLIERIVRETSLSEGDVKNALISLSNVVCEAMQLGMSVDLAELGSFRVVVPSKMMDSAAEVTVKDALKNPKIVFTPKQKMRDAANFHGWRHYHQSGRRSDGKSVGLRRTLRAVAPSDGCSPRVLIE